MNSSLTFDIANTPLPATRTRVVALWYGDVDRIQIDDSNKPFTGGAALFGIYNTAGAYDYYMSLFDTMGVLLHTWACEPKNISITESARFEVKLLEALKAQDIVVTPVFQSMKSFDLILEKLPLLKDVNNNNTMVGDFNPSNVSASAGTKLNPADRNLLKSIVTQL